MMVGLITMGVSASALLLLVWLYRVESESRILLPRARAGFDLVIIWCGNKIRSASSILGAGSFRFLYRYVFYRTITFVVAALLRLQERLYTLLHRHKQFRSAKHSGELNEHFGALASHKEETKLSEAKKRKMRSH